MSTRAADETLDDHHDFACCYDKIIIQVQVIGVHDVYSRKKIIQAVGFSDYASRGRSRRNAT